MVYEVKRGYFNNLHRYILAEGKLIDNIPETKSTNVYSFDDIKSVYLRKAMGHLYLFIHTKTGKKITIQSFHVSGLTKASVVDQADSFKKFVKQFVELVEASGNPVQFYRGTSSFEKGQVVFMLLFLVLFTALLFVSFQHEKSASLGIIIYRSSLSLIIVFISCYIPYLLLRKTKSSQEELTLLLS